MPWTRAVSLAGAALLLAPVGASAQGTERQRMACMTDAMTLCAADVPNTRRIERCLRRNYASVSPACQGELDAASAAAADRDASGAARQAR
ncbi:hypothetical protein ACQVP2_29275 [Methylobacterium aquaticum]|uniref:Uncharacterized protein n=1 Tax=Methylobacterium aquaticum TaxID=270351 RepID=A0A0J6S1R7_9HYPH|nr:hypothetical protein [Methylobacterium aquaticum]KMO29125.1 hypothetical protein VP06_25465 [Methylobacterium aquaticum]